MINIDLPLCKSSVKEIQTFRCQILAAHQGVVSKCYRVVILILVLFACFCFYFKINYNKKNRYLKHLKYGTFLGIKILLYLTWKLKKQWKKRKAERLQYTFFSVFSSISYHNSLLKFLTEIQIS